MTIAAGKLRHRVAIERPSYAQDPETGEQIATWALVATVYAQIEPLSAREFIAAQAVQSKVTTRITIRYRADVDATCRVVHNGRLYDVHGVLADKDSGLEYLTLPVSEGVSDGE